MIRPCPTCDGSGKVQGRMGNAVESCSTCADMPRLPRRRRWEHPQQLRDHPSVCDCGGRGWFRPDPETVIRWCVPHESIAGHQASDCDAYRLQVALRQLVALPTVGSMRADCRLVWLAVPEPLEEA